MFRKPPNRIANLLREVITKYRPDLIGVFYSPQTGDLTAQQRMDLREAVGNELCETGLRENDEPNERGLLLEELIDWLGKELLHPGSQ